MSAALQIITFLKTKAGLCCSHVPPMVLRDWYLSATCQLSATTRKQTTNQWNQVKNKRIQLHSKWSCCKGFYGLFHKLFYKGELCLKIFKRAATSSFRVRSWAVLAPSSSLADQVWVRLDLCMCAGRANYSTFLHKWPRCEMKTAIEGARELGEGERDLKYRGRVID